MNHLCFIHPKLCSQLDKPRKLLYILLHADKDHSQVGNTAPGPLFCGNNFPDIRDNGLKIRSTAYLVICFRCRSVNRKVQETEASSDKPIYQIVREQHGIGKDKNPRLMF